MKIKIYNDLGVSKESAAHCLYSLKLHLPRCCSVGYISAQEIITGHGLKQTYLFVLPGGRDLYYKQKLQGKGNQYIQDYISKGGNFLGICAGSYYSGRYLVFAPGTPIEVVQPRPLGLFQGVVKGPVLAPYYYGSHKGASAARILLIDHTPQKVCYVFYNGGGYFARADRISGTIVIGRYENGEAAIIQSAYGAGKVILSGVHVEYDPTLFDTAFPKSIRDTLHNHNKERAILFKHILKML